MDVQYQTQEDESKTPLVTPAMIEAAMRALAEYDYLLSPTREVLSIQIESCLSAALRHLESDA